jgi:preprotein translocase SecE subunit
MDPEVNAFFIKSKVCLHGLIKSGTGFQQPLDVDGFGQIKPLAVKIAGELGIKVKDDNIAMLAEMAMDRLEQRATQKGVSFLAPAFKKAGIVPFNPDIFTDAQMAGSLLATGLTRDHAAVKKAKGATAGSTRNPVLFVWNYMKQVVAELRKVIWPNRKQMVNYTLVVLVFLVFMTALISGVDLGLAKLVLKVFG